MSFQALDGSVYNVYATDEEISIVDLVKLIGSKMGIEEPAILFADYKRLSAGTANFEHG